MLGAPRQTAAAAFASALAAAGAAACAATGAGTAAAAGFWRASDETAAGCLLRLFLVGEAGVSD